LNEFVCKCTREGLCPKDIFEEFNKEYMNLLPDLFISSRRSKEIFSFFLKHIADLQDGFYRPSSALPRNRRDMLRQEDGIHSGRSHPDSERADVFQRMSQIHFIKRCGALCGKSSETRKQEWFRGIWKKVVHYLLTIVFVYPRKTARNSEKFIPIHGGVV
jgi:hypothetical protein